MNSLPDHRDKSFWLAHLRTLHTEPAGAGRSLGRRRHRRRRLHRAVDGLQPAPGQSRHERRRAGVGGDRLRRQRPQRRLLDDALRHGADGDQAALRPAAHRRGASLHGARRRLRRRAGEGAQHPVRLLVPRLPARRDHAGVRQAHPARSEDPLRHGHHRHRMDRRAAAARRGRFTALPRRLVGATLWAAESRQAGARAEAHRATGGCTGVRVHTGERDPARRAAACSRRRAERSLPARSCWQRTPTLT